MKFAQIISLTGLDPQPFPKCSEIEVSVYDGKDRIHSGEMIFFVEYLFKKNETSLARFHNYLSNLEKENISSMNVKIDENSVVLFYKTARAQLFLRNSTDPLDL